MYAASCIAKAPIALKSRWKRNTSSSCAGAGRCTHNGAMDISEFRRHDTARKLYHFHVKNIG